MHTAMKSQSATIRPIFWAVLALIVRTVINRIQAQAVSIYRNIEQRKPLLKLYCVELRCCYALAAWMDRHPYIVNCILFVLGFVFSIQMFVGFMDYLYGIRY